MKEETRAYLLLHGAVILFGFTAILGSLIHLNAFVLVWWRVLIAAIGISFFTKGIGFIRTIPAKKLLQYIFVGSVIAVHWSLFFLSVKLAGASICLVCMATTSLFISIIEPMMLKQNFQRLDFFIAIMIVPGMILVANSAGISKLWGIVAGLSSAALAGVFSTLNKKYISNVSIWHLSWIEMISAWLTLGILLGIAYLFKAEFKILPSSSDWFYLILLGFLCTTIAHAMSLVALKHISAFALGLVINLEPIYGILLAAVLLREHRALNQNFYIGASLIMFAVFTYPFFKKRFSHAL